MARSAVLNIIFGAETGKLDRALGGVQKRLRRTAGEFQRLGDSMSRSVSLPLIGVGAAAVKSAADLETLETSFVSLAGGAGKAAQLVSELNDFTAKTPFQLEQVGGAARQLIAAGTPISQVKDQLQFLGDVAATSGSSIDEIAAIFSKVQAKGKVELESLNQLAERGIPIFKALSEATGLPASELGAGAVSVKEFNETLASFSEEGGFAAGAMERLSQTAAGKFSTALDNLKLAGAALGEQLLPIVASVLDRVTSLAQAFANTSDGFKTTVLVIGGVVAAMGPLLVAIGSALGAYANFNLLLSGFKARQLASAAATAGDTAAKVTNAAATKGAATAQKSLNLAVLANPYVLAAAALAGLGIALFNANKEVTILQDSVEDLQGQVYDLDFKSAEKRLKSLRGEIEDTAQAAAEDQAWVESLKVQAGTIGFVIDAFTDYDKQLEDAGKSAAELDKIQRKLQSDAEFAAEAEERLAELAAKRAAEAEAARLASLPTLQELQKEAAGFERQILAMQNQAAQGVPIDTLEVEDLQDKLKDTQAQIDLLTAPTAPVKVPIDFGDDGGGIVDDLGEQIAGIEGEFAFTGNEADRVLALADAYRQAAVQAARLGDIELAEQLDAIDPSVRKAADSILRSRDAVAALGVTSDQTTDLLGALGAKSAEVAGVVVASTEQLTPAQQKVQDFASAATSAIEGALVDSLSQVATAIGSAAAGVDEPLKNLGSTLLNTFASLAMELGGLAIGYGIAIEGIKEALRGLQGPVAIAAGVALLALGAGLQAAVSKSADDAGVPAFAQGGLVTGPTLAMVGDNPSGKEAIIPFERMGEFMKMAGGGGGQQNVVVTGRISGKDIVLSNERARRDRSRIK